MLDFAWSEFILLALIALIFLGPKELLILLKTLGKFIGKLRSYQRYFQEQIDAASKEVQAENPHEKSNKTIDIQ